MQYLTTYSTPLGPVFLCSDGKALIGAWLEGQAHFAATVSAAATEKEDLPIFDMTRRWLDRYFAGAQPPPQELPLHPHGSPFRQRVWQILCQIPYGETLTYGEIARQLSRDGRPAAAQAVGGAVGHNPISIIIPCHRVVGAHGKLTGYAGGLAKKQWLLSHEGVDMRRFSTQLEQ